MNLSVTGWIPPQEKQAGNGEEPKRELGQLEGNRTQPLRILPVCRCCSKTKQWPSLCVRCRDRKPAAFYFAYVAFILKPSRSTPVGGDRRREPAQKGKRKERLAMIFFFFGVSQPGSQPVRHEASNPASKQANQSVSFSGATGTGPTNATEQRATVLHHFPSERPRRLQLLITRLCQAAAQGLHQPGLFTAFSHYITIMLRPHSGRGFCFSGPRKASKT